MNRHTITVPGTGYLGKMSTVLVWYVTCCCDLIGMYIRSNATILIVILHSVSQVPVH